MDVDPLDKLAAQPKEQPSDLQDMDEQAANYAQWLQKELD